VGVSIISNRKLEEMGFVKKQPTTIEKEFMNDWMMFKKNNCVLEVTTEYDLSGKPTNQYFDFNGQTLKGLVRPFEIMQLKEMM